MAEVTHRSFDLKSWQGLTDVLKFARESHASPAEYAEFRNLVLQYAQQKGSDPELKGKIESLIELFTKHQADAAVSSVTTEPTPPEETDPVAQPIVESRRTRAVPSFVPPHNTTESPGEPVPPEPSVVPKVEEEEIRVSPPTEVVPSHVVERSPMPETLKSVEEHRARIMEIKRRVNSLVGNPVTLMDHGNHVGREYMTALLTALKATSPGSTLNIESAMSALESAFEKILELGRTPAPADRSEEEAVETDERVEASVNEEPAEMSQESVSEAEEEAVVPPAEEATTESASTPPAQGLASYASRTEPATDVRMDEQETEDVSRIQEVTVPEDATTTESTSDRWSETGGDADVTSQIKVLRETLKEREITPTPHTETARARRPLIASLVDMEDEPLPQTLPASERMEDSSRAPYVPENAQTIGADELSTPSLTNRPLSSLTGITLGTPQAELVTPEVTGVLTQLLHDWSIFASSGIFGMGPSGIDHPLYEKLSRLPMGEVLSGRFESADMKLVRNIKEYVNAWRHEQGIAYNPSETFEHYLRRVAQRILKRQNCVKAV